MIIKSYVVTTAHKAAPDQINLAQKLSKKLGFQVVPREKLSIPALLNKYCVKGVIVVTSDKVYFTTGKEEFFFHPNMAAVRIKDLRSGKTDQMINAMDLNPGDIVLDCTLGYGADAIVASHIVGITGKVVGLEASNIIAELVSYGLKNYPIKSKLLSNVMKNILVINTEHFKYLQRMASNSVDVVYFDPMFRKPKLNSLNMSLLRILANPEPLSLDSLHEAVRVAKKRVVIKERRGSKEFDRFGVDRIEGGKYAPIVYGVVDV